MQQASALSQPNSSQQKNGQPVYKVTDADKKRQKAIALAWKAYCGELDPPLQKTPEGVDPNVLSNRMSPIVDGGVDFLFGKEVEFAVEDSAPDEAQQLLDTVWGRKEKRIPLLQDLAMNGAIAGQSFLRIVPGPKNTYRLVVVDPAIVVGVQTAPQDCETVLLYCIEYCQDAQVNGKAVKIFYREEIVRVDPLYDDDNIEDQDASELDTEVTWSIQHWTRIGDSKTGDKGSTWMPAGEPIVWPYEFAPLFSCKNLPNPNSFWGKPDVSPDLIGMNKALNLVQSCINLVELLYGQPILYANGVGDQVIDVRTGKIIALPLPESKISAVAISSEVPAALDFAVNLRSDIDEQSHVPGVATGRISELPRGNMSGIAIELLFMPLLKKTEGKRCRYGELMIDVCKALFVLNHLSPDIDVELAWQNPLIARDLQSAQAAVLFMQVGVSKTTIQRDLGYDPTEEANLAQSEAEADLNNYTQGQGMPPGSPPASSQQPSAPGQQVPMQQGGQQQ